MSYESTDTPEAWGGAGVFLLNHALAFYHGTLNGRPNIEAGDSHLETAIQNFREAHRRAIQQLGKDWQHAA